MDKDPKVIIINDDIPIVMATYYPFKTSAPSATTAANISIGVIVIIFIAAQKSLRKIGSHI